ncbi:divergent protein kinase domain 2B [Clupea harengus]|uniref:Divergent protein kinase domain 2B n=1 Tax=Clupea harengus TaxID=7950 RepID=A0A6P3WAI0_CLUHA|nr:divergent protein kinase domain 2B [Clupea harengus]
MALTCPRVRAWRVPPAVWLWVVSWALAVASAYPPPTRQEKAYSFGRSFLGLDRCNACVGTSICKKLFKEDIRFDRWLSSHLELPKASRQSYQGNLTDDSETWRPVVLSRLLSAQRHQLSDRSICSSARRPPTCSIEVALRATPRFQSWARSHLLLPSMVQGLSAPLLRCPSQRLLDRVVRRYAEVLDVGSVQMKHFSDRDKLRLLYTLAVNQHPLMLQMFPGTEGWPFPRYHGSCGRLVVWAGSRHLSALYSAPLEERADAAYQLLNIAQGLGTNSLRFRLYYTEATEDMFGLAEDGRMLVMDASGLGVIDLQEGFPPDDHDTNRANQTTDVFSCLSGSCERPPPCSEVRPSQSFALLCRNILPRLLPSRELRPPRLPSQTARELATCADATRPDGEVTQAACSLMDILRTMRPCSPRYGYRYPECIYNNRF